ncbi:MAG: FAD-binding oxidoreductase, partial [Actinobacteria bacterium]|nr:FAD-binding oxidoreductase [Actinomycetota bacterium]
SDFVGVEDPDGMAKFVKTGYLVFLTEGYDGVRQRELWDQFGIPYEVLSPEEVRKRWPAFETGKFYPPKSIEDPAFADDPYDQLSALFDPLSGFMDDPMLAAHNLAHAAKSHGAEFFFHKEVSGITKSGDRVTGVTLASGESISAPIVINAAGPHAAKINRLAGVYDEMKVHHQPLRQEVFSPPAPVGFRLEDNAPIVADLDLGQYFRPHMGDLLNVGTTEPACDPLHFIEDADDWNDQVTVEFFERVMLRLARRLPDFGIPLKLLGIGALYDVTDDWIPLSTSLRSRDRRKRDGLAFASCERACKTSSRSVGPFSLTVPPAPTISRLVSSRASRRSSGSPITRSASSVSINSSSTPAPTSS